MFKIVPMQDVQMKTYWCADLLVAEKVASDLQNRCGFDWEIIEVPQKTDWCSRNTAQARAFQLQQGLRLGCSEEQLNEALNHAQDNILKIKDEEEIFCFQTSDPFWQHQYLCASV